MQIAELYQIYLDYPSICTDTRQIIKDCIFFALKGESFNGNTFAEKALEAGAKYVVLDDPDYVQDGPAYILVEDVLSSLQALATHHRKQLDIPFVGITGTNGKTTSKELLYSVLSQKFKAFATKGNLNNHIGVPLTILSLPKDLELAIIEMGANHQGEIEFLCHIAQPSHGLITNVGKAHLEGFGSFEGVMKTKGELYDYLKEHHGQVFVQGDNEFLMQMAEDRKLKDIVYYGFSDKNDIQGGLVVADPLLTIFWKERGENGVHEVNTHLTGAYNTENMLAAVAVGLHFGLSAEEINAGLEGYVPQNNRSQITKTDGNIIIADYYNANASSMAAAIENIKVIKAERKAAILGDMFEMGNQSVEEHRKVIAAAKAVGLDRLIFVGKAFFGLRDEILESEKDEFEKDVENVMVDETKAVEFYETTEEAKAALVKDPIKDFMILLKASRGMAFERLMEAL